MELRFRRRVSIDDGFGTGKLVVCIASLGYKVSMVFKGRSILIAERNEVLTAKTTAPPAIPAAKPEAPPAFAPSACVVETNLVCLACCLMGARIVRAAALDAVLEASIMYGCMVRCVVCCSLSILLRRMVCVCV